MGRWGYSRVQAANELARMRIALGGRLRADTTRTIDDLLARIMPQGGAVAASRGTTGEQWATASLQRVTARMHHARAGSRVLRAQLADAHAAADARAGARVDAAVRATDTRLPRTMGRHGRTGQRAADRSRRVRHRRARRRRGPPRTPVGLSRRTPDRGRAHRTPRPGRRRRPALVAGVRADRARRLAVAPAARGRGGRRAAGAVLRGLPAHRPLRAGGDHGDRRPAAAPRRPAPRARAPRALRPAPHDALRRRDHPRRHRLARPGGGGDGGAVGGGIVVEPVVPVAGPARCRAAAAAAGRSTPGGRGRVGGG